MSRYGRRRRWRDACGILAATGVAALFVTALIRPDPLRAQYLGGGTRDDRGAQLADLERMGERFASLAAAFPEDRWEWRPMDGVRSVREVVALVAAEATLFPTMWGFEAPPWVPDPGFGRELERLRGSTPGELVAEVERSFDHVVALVGELAAGERARPVGFFGLEVPLGTAITLMGNDMHEHLGQLIAYARVNRVVPPWSRSGGEGGEAGGGEEEARAGEVKAGDIFVANLRSDEVARFDAVTGAYLGPFVEPGTGGLAGATGLAFGPAGDLYVASSRNHRILRYDGVTGAFAGVFVDGGELESPFSLVFGPDGDLYVSSGTGDRVLRFDGGTGAYAGVAAEGGGLRQPIGLAFGPRDGLLYVVSSGSRRVLRFDPTTGRALGTFATDSLRFPSDLAFGPDGDLYVSSAASSAVVRYDGATGELVGVHLRLPGDGGAPMGLAFLDDGALVVGDFGRDRLYLSRPGGAVARLLADSGLAGPENVAVRPGR